MKKIIILITVCMFLITGCGGSNKKIASLQDAAHSRIGVMTGTTGEQLAHKKYPEATIKSFDDVMDAIAALKSDQIDAVITGFPAAMNVCKKNKDLRFLKEAVDYENTAIAMRKENVELLNQLNDFITSLENDGTLKDMAKRWFKEDTSPYETPEIKVPEKGDVLKIGVAATREPFCFMDSNKKVSGLDGELSRRISAKLGRPVEFVDMKFSALITSLQSGKIDLIISGMTATPERAKKVSFTKSYFMNSQVMLVKKTPGDEAASGSGNKETLKSIEDIKDKRVGVYAGTIHDGYVIEKYPKADIKRYNSTSDMILALRTEKIDVAFFALSSAKTIISTNPDVGILTDKVLDLPTGFGFSKNNSQLRDKFNNYLKKIKADGSFDAIYKRWFIDDANKARMPQYDLNKSGKKIVLAVATGDLPFSSLISNEYVGFDIEMIKSFAKNEGYNLEIQTMDFSALVAALAAGKVDIIADGICITPERQKMVDFSDNYLNQKTAVVALNRNMGIGGAEEKKVSAPTFFDDVATSFNNNIIVEKRYMLILDGLKTTGIISILSILFGTVLGGLVCFTRMSKKKYLQIPARAYISLLRGTPVLVLLMIIFYVIFASMDIDPVIVAVIAFGMNFAAYVSEMFRTGIEGVDLGQTEAGIAMGFTKAQTFIFIIAPQAIRRILPVYKGEVISLVKMTSIVGYIAVQDLTKASDIIRSRTFDAFFPLIMVAVLYFFIAWLLMLALGYMERLFDPKTRIKRG